MKLRETKYGYFDKETNEYVITRPDTPSPWVNHLGETERFAGVISNTAGGYTYHLDPGNKRITRFRHAAIPEDRPGRYTYIRDEETGEYWSASWQPVVNRKGDYEYECRHGFGYTSIKYSYKNIESTSTYFVPVGKDFELWKINIKNNSDKKRKLKIFAYNEWCMWSLIKDQYNAQSIENEARSKFIPENNAFYHHTYADPGMSLAESEFFEWVSFFALSNKPDGITYRRDRFIGPYRDESCPIALEEGKSDDFYAGGGYHIAAPMYELELEPGEEKPFFFALGSYDKIGEEQNDVKPLLTVKGFSEKLTELKKYWAGFASRFSCSTPDDGMDIFLGGWHQYNLVMDLWKVVNYSYTGWGGSAVGFRNRAQKVVALSSVDIDFSKKAVETLLSIQYECGDAPGSYSPLSGAKAGKGGFSDVPMYLIYAVEAIIKETGDKQFLNKELPFFEGSKATVFEHLKRIIDWIWSRRGPHGLPVIGIADWNDAINLNGKGETQMAACQFVHACRILSVFSKILGEDGDKEKFSKLGDEMKDIINEHCWDGEWYIRAFDINGSPVGSSKNEHGKIFLNAQSWAVISGVAEGERKEKCLLSTRKYLFTKCGLKSCTPAYPAYDDKIGPIGSMVPGLKENGAIFCHAHAWGIIAATAGGKGDWAHEYYDSFLPCNQDPDISTAEPYTFCQTYASDEHPEHGLGRLHWHSGTIPWTYVASTQQILGIKPDYDGLLIDPCLPKSWKQYSVKRIFRGTEYNITVKNPDGVSGGVQEITVNGEKQTSPLIKATDAKKAEVEVLLG
ncbi:MAG: GH36-type glycosyl hydrolase domain-containing protein [Fibrobacterota bacterium]